MSGVDIFFNPKSVAVIGASKAKEKVGYAVITNIIKSGYQGEIYPINPKESEMFGYKVYPSIDVAPETDLAVIAVPAPYVASVAEACGKKGVKGLVVITAGFKEVGKEGLALEKELMEIVDRYDMQMMGPNCLGYIDTHTPINASFVARPPLKGDIAFFSQSGAVCVAVLEWSLKRNIGYSKFISMGNKAHLNEADFIEEAAKDPHTKVIAGYIESVEEGERFLEVAREASKEKPIVLIKSGVSEAGAKAASSHTGALAGSNVAYDTAFRQAGIMRAKSLQELFDLASAFAKQDAPKGNRVAIVTNAGGPGIIATDSVELNDLKMASFEKETVDNLRAGLPAESNVYNPVDVIGDAGEDRFRYAMEHVMKDPNVDAVLVLMVATAMTGPHEIAELTVEMHKKYPDVSVVGAFMGGETIDEAFKLMSDNNIPAYTFPEQAIESLARLVQYNELRERLQRQTAVEEFDVNKEAVASIFKKVKEEDRVVLLGSEAMQVIEAYGIGSAPVALAKTAEQAGDLADAMGYPVVLKVASPKIMHKTDVGGVKLKLQTREEVEQGFIEILENVHRYLPDVLVDGIEVQKMLPQGREMIIGMFKDVQFGPMIMFGLGGIYVNLLQDVSFRLANGLNREEAMEMIQETKAYTLLKGYRGEKQADIDGVVETILRVSKLVTDFPEITELDINPLFAYEESVNSIDVKITIS